MVSGEGVSNMRPLACLLRGHKWKLEHIEDSTYRRCERCGAEDAPLAWTRYNARGETEYDHES